MTEPQIGEPDRGESLDSGANRDDLHVSVVIPCLNEALTIKACVRQAWSAIKAAGLRGEVVVVDNGSTDRSAELAAAAGARIVTEPRPGYGQAYLAGFREARGGAVLMGDGDGTYDFGELPRFYALFEGGADLIMARGSRGTSSLKRCRGSIAGSAIPR